MGRAPFRLAGVAVLLAAIFLLLAVLGAGRFDLVGGARRRRACAALRRRLLRQGSRALLGLLGVEVRCAGAPPRAPFVLVSNHLSYLDVAVLASLAPCTFVAKSEVRSWPLLGPIVRAFGTVFLDREHKVDLPLALAAMDEALERGEGVVIFPEGTTSNGAEVAPFRSSLLALPARRGLPVHAAALRYATPEGEPPAAEAVCWWGDGELVSHIVRLAQLSRVEATVAFAPLPLQDRDRKRLAARLEKEVRALASSQAGGALSEARPERGGLAAR